MSNNTCKWVYDISFYGFYKTQCNHRFNLIDQDVLPQDVDMKYCPFCSKVITLAGDEQEIQEDTLSEVQRKLNEASAMLARIRDGSLDCTIEYSQQDGVTTLSLKYND